MIERSLTVQGGGTSVKAEMELMSKSDHGFCSNLNRQPPQRKARRQSTKPPHSNDARSFSVPATNVPMNGVGLEIARTPRPLNCKGLVCVCVFFYYPINTLLRVSRRALPTVIVNCRPMQLQIWTSAAMHWTYQALSRRITKIKCQHKSSQVVVSEQRYQMNRKNGSVKTENAPSRCFTQLPLHQSARQRKITPAQHKRKFQGQQHAPQRRK